MKSLLIAFFFTSTIFIGSTVQAQNVYTWEGSISEDYTLDLNWNPVRLLSIISTDDILIFNTGGTVVVSNMLTQSLGGIQVKNNTEVIFAASTVNKVMTILDTPGVDLLVEEGSSLTFKNNGGVQIDVDMAANTSAEIGGKLTVERGTFDFNNADITLHTNTSPLNTVSGIFTLDAAASMTFGKAGKTPAGQIVLQDDLFATSPTVQELEINSVDGVKLGNQPFTVTDQVTFKEGDLETNSIGRLIFANTASIPVESTNSKIIGFAEMTTRAIGTGGVSFLGYTVDPGIDDIGNVSILKMTGPAGVNFNSDSESIAVTWDVTVQNQPINGRDVTMQWYSEFDNGNDISLPMQMYRYTDGTAWEVVGGATAIASSVDGLRTSATILTTHFSQWTISSTDNALPVSLISFEGNAQSGSVALNWATASELNNDRFIIEKMDEGEFTYLGSVEGNGTSVEVNNYSFDDDQPANGNNYYRLVQQDFDGKLTVHETITVEYTKSITGFEIYPNPSTGSSLNVNFENKTGERASVKIFDANGTLIINKQVGNALKADLLEGNELSRGLYYLEFTDNENSSKKRLIVR